MPESDPNLSTSDPPSFEQALATLEQIVHDLEDGRLGLAESLARYEQGVKLLKQCHQLLERAERRIELLTGSDAAGNPITEAFDDQATLTEVVEEVVRRKGRSGKSGKKSVPETTPEAERPSSTMDEPGGLF